MTASQQDPEDKGFDRSIGEQAADRGEREAGRFQGDEHGSSPDVGSASDMAKQAGDRAFEARDTQPTSKSEEGAEVAPQPGVEDVGRSIGKRGEDRAKKTEEPGRTWIQEEDSERPQGGANARYSSGVNPQGPIEDEASEVPPGDQGG